MSSKKIGIIIGSLRKKAFSRIVGNKVKTLFPSNYDVEIVEIGHLEFYNQDYDESLELPDSYIDFRKKIKQFDGIVFVTPEYNRSVPAVLKNAIDVASRPYTENAWSGKTALVISLSTGNIGGFGANHHLRQSLLCINVLTMPQPEVYLSNIFSSIENGELTKQDTISFLQKVVDKFVTLTEKNT